MGQVLHLSIENAERCRIFAIVPATLMRSRGDAIGVLMEV